MSKNFSKSAALAIGFAAMFASVGAQAATVGGFLTVQANVLATCALDNPNQVQAMGDLNLNSKIATAKTYALIPTSFAVTCDAPVAWKLYSNSAAGTLATIGADSTNLTCIAQAPGAGDECTTPIASLLGNGTKTITGSVRIWSTKTNAAGKTLPYSGTGQLNTSIPITLEY